ncbi:SusC/RagA family TonB-linked outer membrane protein [Carboxylicivirga linearis]|uniref:SusC/RagA family TonB-linked outer membrane protein n=1 Tax=Carboxylicivirga linearis TaxID=1628157 RepID=A0ABS5JT95_9BACT|nr:SusC/RagA family TonB-linked outer membrane protein [Carboxylicivirga linearis]MBS2098087.1 SusC/RagA family TonB-linked outer membrane protein [Carboxylicivirga linearis]
MTKIKFIYLLIFVFIGGSAAIAQVQESELQKITGTVFDIQTNEPVEFVAIDNDSIASTFSDIEGKFEIGVISYQGVLKVSAFGYISQDIVIAGRSEINIYMAPLGYSSFQRDYHTGFYSTKQAYSTQAVTNLQVNTPYDNAALTGAESGESTFKGRVPGMEVLSRSGVPGVGSDIFLRGFSSLYGNNRPLIVVDGMIYDDREYGTSIINGQRKNQFTAIDITDIENISVVKDAVSIFGSKAANGVVYIRTNHATEQSNKIEFNMSGGINLAPQGYPLMEADDFSLFLSEMLQSQGLSTDSIRRLPYMINTPGYEEYYRYHNNTDWQKELFAQSYNTNVGFRITGGDDVALYALSVGYLKNEGTVTGTDYSKFNMRFNSDINISKVFSLNSNISFMQGQQNHMSGTGLTSLDNPYYQTMVKSPLLTMFNRTSTGVYSPVYEDYDVFGNSNPASIMQSNNPLEQQVRNYRFVGSFNFNAKVNKNLTVHNLIGVVFDKDRETFFIPSYGIVPDTTDLGVIYNRNGFRTVKQFTINNDFRVNYDKTFNRVHDFNAVAGARINMNRIEEDRATGANTPSDQYTTVGQGNAIFNQSGGFLSDWSSITYYAMANYGFSKKYFLSASLALDGASHFGSEADGLKIGDFVYGVFPSISGAWLLSSENFLSNLSFVNLLKLRASYGLTGNDDYSLYHRYKYYSAINYLGQQGIIRGNIPNPAIQWETNTKVNVGMDMELLRSRLIISADIYQNTTDNLVENKVASIYSGEANYFFNNGSFTTQGIDLGITGKIISGTVNWDLGLAIGKYTTEVTALNDNRLETEMYGATILTEVGKPIGVFYGYETNGVYATTEAASNANLGNLLPNTSIVPFEAGDVIFVDHHKDNIEGEEYTSIIDENDRVVIGDPTPDFFGEINTRVNYKDITLVANVGFSYGNDVFNYMRSQLENMDSYNNQTKAVRNRWRYEGQVTTMPKATYDDPMMNNRFSDRWIEDGSYIRLRNVTLSYKLPIKTGFMERPEIYVTGNNLLTFTKYKGLDPDFSAGNSTLTKGIDVGLVPQSQSILLGLKLKL